MIKHRNLYKVDSNGNVRVYFIEQEDEKYRMVTGILDGKFTRSKWTVAKPKNVGRANETTAKTQADSEISSRYVKKLNEGYFGSLEEADSNPGGKFFEPMLASVWEKIKDKDKSYPLLVDPKLDGMRMTITKEEAITRKGKPIMTADHIKEELKGFLNKYPNIRLDGELYNHDYRDDFNALMSIARKTKPTEEDLKVAVRDLQYHVYDMYDYNNPAMPAWERKQWLLLNLPLSDSVFKVPYHIAYDEWDLKDLKEKNILNGYEGTIVRIYNSPYVNKRTKNLIKIKDFITEEYEIIDILPGKGNKSDIAGRILVDVNGTSVGCGIRGDWKYCNFILLNKDSLIGKEATVRHFGKTPDGSLRFPVCIDIDRPD